MRQKGDWKRMQECIGDHVQVTRNEIRWPANRDGLKEK